MTDKAVTDEAASLLAKMGDARGYVHPAHSYLAKECPEFLVAWNDLVGAALLHDGQGDAELPIKYRELIVACLLCLVRVPEESIAAHLRRAMRDGLTTRAALEAFQAASVPGGAPVLMLGVRALMLIADTEAGESAAKTDQSPL